MCNLIRFWTTVCRFDVSLMTVDVHGNIREEQHRNLHRAPKMALSVVATCIDTAKSGR